MSEQANEAPGNPRAAAPAPQAQAASQGEAASQVQVASQTAAAPQGQTTAQATTASQGQPASQATAAPQEQPCETLKGPRLIDHMQWGWLAVFVLAICFIWGNSMRQGVDSTHLSTGALSIIQDILHDLGLPGGWLTDHIVRKTAHFTEYTALGIIAMQAFTPHRDTFSRAALGAFFLAVVAVPCLDETLQLFVDGRSGQVSDVLLDCGGILFGCLLTLAASAVYAKLHSRPAPQETAAEPLAPTAVIS